MMMMMMSTRRTIITSKAALSCRRWMPTAATAAASIRSSSTAAPAKYAPTMVEKRYNDVGHGGRGSDKGVKVACFGASGFLGKYVGAELGKFPIKKKNRWKKHKKTKTNVVLGTLRALKSTDVTFSFCFPTLLDFCNMCLYIYLHYRCQWIHDIFCKSWRRYGNAPSEGRI